MNQRFTILHILSLLLIGFTLITCSQDPLPKPSQTGQNTFGCLINGNAYVPDGGPPFSGIRPIVGGFSRIYNSSNITRGIYITTYAKDKQRVDLYLSKYTLGQHSLNFTTGVSPAALTPKDYGLYVASNGDEYVTSVKHTGWINLARADTTTGVVAGTFEFIAATPDGRTIKVTNGRFDVNARTQ